MTHQTFLLIPTADELTWKFDRPVLFLGEWCRRFNRKNTWENMDAIVAAPYGCSKAKKDSDRIQVKYLEQKYFPQLCLILNIAHNTDFNERFWKILLGSWFERYSKLILNRVRTLELCLQSYTIDSVVTYSQEGYSLATGDSHNSMLASNDDIWNHYLTLRILESFQNTKISKQIVASTNPSWFNAKERERKLALKGRFKESFYDHCRKLAIRFTRQADAMIIGSYLSLKTELMLQVALGQFPKWLLSQKLDSQVEPNIEIRRNLTNHMKNETTDLLENVFQTLVFELLPMCYLEGFENLNKQVNEERWPSKPKFIFSSNNFEYDEVFKLWAAKKILGNTPLIFGQHGNCYGTHKYFSPSVEEIVCDKFITWGWTSGLDQHTPAFLFRNAGKKFKNTNPIGKLLLIETHEENRFQTWDTSFEFLKYFEEQVKFADHLELGPRDSLIVRLALFSQQLFGFENERWKDYDLSIQVESGTLPIADLISDSRLVVHSYDSTGMLETLSRNIPTLAFWQNDLGHLRESALEDYELLVDAGIIHFSPESAANKVNEVWNDVNGWWLKESVQNARKQYCQKYARVSEHPVRDLKKILLDNSVRLKQKT